MATSSQCGDSAGPPTEATPLLLGRERKSNEGLVQVEVQERVHQDGCQGNSAESQAPTDASELHVLAPALVGSAKKTFFNIVITIIGSGVLGLPYTFMKSGWLTGSVAIMTSALLSFHCMLLLVRCRKKLASRGVLVNSYSGVGLHACGDLGERAVDAMVLISQGGCCVAYLIFISQNLKSMFCSPPEPGTPHYCSGSKFVFLAMPFQIALSWVSSLAGLVPFSIVADVANLLAMGLVVRADLQSFEDFENIQSFTGLASIPFALGVACYCYEGFAMTLPLEASMKNPKRFPLILGLAMAAVTALYLTFGIVGYIVFKDKTKEIITLNLPNDFTTVSVKLGLCLGLFLTFPVMMHPVHEIVEDNISRTTLYSQYIRPHPSLNDATKKVIRSTLVLLTAVVAIRVPAFAKFIALVGSSVCAMLAFVLPGSFHFLLSAGEDRNFKTILRSVCDLVVASFGILFAVYGTYDAAHRL